MKSKRRRSRTRKNKVKLDTAGAGFTEAEEAFFRAGAMAADAEPVETFADLDQDVPAARRPSLLRRLFWRAQAA